MKKRLAIVMTVMALLFCTGTITYAASWTNQNSSNSKWKWIEVILDILGLDDKKDTPCYPVTEHSQYKEDGCIKCGTCVWTNYVKPNGNQSTC